MALQFSLSFTLPTTRDGNAQRAHIERELFCLRVRQLALFTQHSIFKSNQKTSCPPTAVTRPEPEQSSNQPKRLSRRQFLVTTEQVFPSTPGLSGETEMSPESP
jgi:hypothetical protein